MPALFPREKRILFFTAGVAALAILYHFLLEPFCRTWKELSTEVRVAEARLQKTRYLLRKKSDIEEAFKKYSGASLEKEEGSEEVMTGILTNGGYFFPKPVNSISFPSSGSPLTLMAGLGLPRTVTIWSTSPIS